MLLAELEIRHSRAIAPTRRIALGRLWLPTDPAPGPGGLLVAAVVAAGVSAIDDDDTLSEVDRLLDDFEARRRVVQPRVRHRFQTDVHGLDRSLHRLLDQDGRIVVDIDGHGAPLPQVLGAIYAAGRLSYNVRPDVLRLLRKATFWNGGIDDALISFLQSNEAPFVTRGLARDQRWALRILGFGADDEPERDEVQKRFRKLVREAHPDHGAEMAGAGQRMLELTEARRILLP